MEVTFEAWVWRYAVAPGKANVELILLHGDNKNAKVLEQMSADGTRSHFTIYPVGAVGKEQTVPLCGVRYTSTERERAVKLAIEDYRAGPEIRAMLDGAAFGHERRRFKLEAIQKELPGVDEVRKLDENLKKHGASATFEAGGHKATIGAKEPKKKTARPRKVVKKKKGFGGRGFAESQGAREVPRGPRR